MDQCAHATRLCWQRYCQSVAKPGGPNDSAHDELGGAGGRAFANEFLARADAAKLLDKRAMLRRENLALIDGLTRRDNREMVSRYVEGRSADQVGGRWLIRAWRKP